MGYVILLIVIGILVVLLCYLQYWRPRVVAYKTGANRVPIWFGSGELILWNPGQTFAFLRNKSLHQIGDSKGGFRRVYAYRGEEAIGPIQLQSALCGWEDQNVLTSDGQPLSIKVGIWWRVKNAEKYVFEIYADAKNGSGIVAGLTGQGRSANASFDSQQVHQVADQWLRVITESTIRAKINTLTVAEVVSAQAVRFLHHGSDEAAVLSSAGKVSFEAAVLSVLGDVQSKAVQFGIEVERLEVQHIYLPEEIQNAINETRIAFLAPIKGEREAEAQRITLEKLVSVLGKDTVGLNEVMKNLKHANFVAPSNLLQPIFDNLNRKAEALSKDSEKPKQLPGV